MKQFVENFQKICPHRIQGYSIYSEKKSIILHLARMGLANFEFSWLKTFTLSKFEVMLIFS